MIIKRVGLGNSKEAYIENRISAGVNIIYSNDNNKGKTIIIQSISYALGASDTFPSGIDVSNYYVYLECEIDGDNLEIIRRKKNVMVIFKKELYLFDTVSEFTYFFDDKIAKLPRYIKDGRERLAGFLLFYEMSIIPQDKRNPSNIINKAGTNKEDFLQMLSSIMGCSYSSETNIEDVEKNIKNVNYKISNVSKKINFAKKNSQLYENLSTSFDRKSYDESNRIISKFENEISEYKRKRTTEKNRIIKLNNLLSELRSISRKIDEGYFICSECGSLEVQYKKGNIVFETSNPDVRSSILGAIEKQIEIKESIITEYNNEIDKIIKKKMQTINSIPSDVNDYFLHLDEIKNLSVNIENLDKLNRELDDLKKERTILLNSENSSKEEYKKMLNSIVRKMNELQQKIEKNSEIIYKEIFAKQNSIFSGSTENEYYFCRCVALASIINHDLPIIIDAFRDGELSTTKENNMIDIYKTMNRQVILTATLKDEEFVNKDKYENVSDINAINYESVLTYKLLNESYVNDFKNIINKFGIVLEQS
ncbi:DNA repair exonuclease SbcCD ATPase subunit [Bacilli bacterium PM5-9]|nr:DNA repair exonuclease SbcCD ATPase subunit [Bacilli bacterium PM5-9]